MRRGLLVKVGWQVGLAAIAVSARAGPPSHQRHAVDRSPKAAGSSTAGAANSPRSTRSKVANWRLRNQASARPSAPGIGSHHGRSNTRAVAYFESLGKQDGWLGLGHYRRSSEGWRSEIEDVAFFLAPDGRQDPEAELRATFDQLATAPAQVSCRFPARVRWLCRQGVHAACAVERRPQCSAVRQHVINHPAGRVVLGFASYYPRQPASLFGHTFLWVVPEAGQRYRNASAGRVISFDADITKLSPLSYAPKALAGLLVGGYSSVPFDQRERGYRFMERRDLWLFPLRLPPSQAQLLVLHIYELLGKEVAYGFTKKNCSYRLLGLINAVVPQENLSDAWGPFVSPAATIERLSQHQLLAEGWRRPSLWQAYGAARDALTPEQEREFQLLSGGQLDPAAASLPVLDTALLQTEIEQPYSTFASPRSETNRSPAESFSSWRRRLLLERMGRASGSSLDDLAHTRSTNESPGSGHGTSRLGVGMGRSEHLGDFLAFHARAALHDRDDAPRGYPSEILLSALDVEFRWLLGRGKLWVQDFALARVGAMTNLLSHQGTLAWQVGVDGVRLPNNSGPTVLHAGAGGEVGLSGYAKVASLEAGFFALAGARLGAAFADSASFAPVVLARGGLEMALAGRSKLSIQALASAGRGLPRSRGVAYDAVWASSLSRNAALQVYGRVDPSGGEVSAALSFYY